MKNVLFLSVFILSSFCAFSQDKKADKIYYVSLNLAVQQGQYEGLIQLKNLKEHGDFGLGTEELLASEFVLLNEAYSIPATGKASSMKNEAKIAFAAVKFFKSDTTFSCSDQVSYKKLEDFLKKKIDTNAFAAIKIRTRFSDVKYRSFKTQQKPFIPVLSAPADTFTAKDVDAVLVGFYTPESSLVLNSPQFHFHMINVHKSTGGHVLECTIEYADIEVDYAQSLEILLPDRKLMKQLNINKSPKE